MKLKFVEPKDGIGIFLFDCFLVASLFGGVIILINLIENYG